MHPTNLEQELAALRAARNEERRLRRRAVYRASKLDAHGDLLTQLRALGASVEEIVSMLKVRGIHAHPTTVRKWFARADARVQKTEEA